MISIETLRPSGATAVAAALAMSLSLPAAEAAVTTYSVTQTYNQVVYDASHPDWDTIFTGTFTYDDLSQTVGNLQGSLTEAMTGNTLSVPLVHQLSSVSDGMGGLLVSVFALESTDVFAGGGFATGGRYTFGNFNAYVTIDVSLSDPTAALDEARIGKLAYADCAAGGLMPMNLPPEERTVCMTGWQDPTRSPPAGGTMKGTWPITQTIAPVATVPLPAGCALLLSALGLSGALARRRPRA